MALNFKNMMAKATPAGRIRTNSVQMAGGTGPVRVKKAPSLMQSIFGVLIGIALVFGSPIAMWQAQSQTRAKDFNSAQMVEADSGTTGYIVYEGTPSYAPGESGTDCHVGNCLYEEVSFQELITSFETICQERVKEDQFTRVIRQNDSECDEDGQNCVPCWEIEKDSWEEQSSSSIEHGVVIGGLTATPSSSAILFDTKETIVNTGFNEVTYNDTRTVYNSFIMPATLLIAGDSNGSLVREGEKVFVFSKYSHGTTLEKLEAMDKATRIILWIVTFLMLFIGIGMILGPLSWAGRQLRYIPLVGSFLKDATGAIIGLISFLIAVPLWLLIFVSVVLLKLWWLGLIVVALIVGFIVWKAKKDDGDAPTVK